MKLYKHLGEKKKTYLVPGAINRNRGGIPHSSVSESRDMWFYSYESLGSSIHGNKDLLTDRAMGNGKLRSDS